VSDMVLSCRGLTKTFDAVTALSEVDFDLHRGEVRALLGKNGAGKSTLVNLISGAFKPDSGSIELDGERVVWAGPSAAQAGGIAVVHQEFSLVPGLSVAENVTLGRWPKKLGLIDNARVNEVARQALEKLGVKVPLSAEVQSLPLAEQQLVEIAKALVGDPRVLILDEPTSALNSREVETLLALIRRLASTGISVIYVSHRMKEIPLVADTLTVLRDGEEISTQDVASVSSEQVASLVSGTPEKSGRLIAPRKRSDRVVLEAQGISYAGRLDEASFSLAAGEVLGLAGLLGSGRTELLQSVFGQLRGSTGTVILNGSEVKRRSPRKMLNLGVGYTPEDRKGWGIFPVLGLDENILVSARGRVLPKFWRIVRRERRIVSEMIASLGIRASSPQQPIGTLSGGNQQKAVIGRALAANLQILLLDEPTRGVDLEAKAQLYDVIRGLADEGISIIFVSSELEEIAEVCDRALILRDGHVYEDVKGSEATPEKVLALAMKQEDVHE